jgi:hypothetical protein
MMDFSSEYSRFAQKYIEAWDEYKGLEGEALEYQMDGDEIPESLKREIDRHKIIIGTFAMIGKDKYSKEHNELYNDGWKFWMAEDAYLREKRYGNK